ncbi:MAG: NFACT family protein [Candidatus Eisenbacteria bacterium]|nr:NFACT family protein [Candidatus Eisenbacteria bacterium]
MENLILALLVKELSNELLGSTVKAVTGLAPMSFAVELEKKGHDTSSLLVICLASRFPALFSLEAPALGLVLSTPAETLPEGFVQSASERLRGTVLHALEQHDADRVVKIEFAAASNKDRPLFSLWLELFGRRPSAVLVRSDGNAIEACSREGTTSSAGILLRPGEKYAPPSQEHKLSIGELSLNALHTLMEGADSEAGRRELCLALSRRLKGLSPHAAEGVIEYLHSCGRLTPEDLRKGLGEALAEPDRHFCPAVMETAARPDEHSRRSGKIAASGLIEPPSLLPVYVKTRPSLTETEPGSTDTTPAATSVLKCFPAASEAVRFSFFGLCRWYRGLSAARLKEHAAALSDKLGRLRASLLEDLSSAEQAHEFRRTGELILANLGTLRRGSTLVELKDIHVDGQSLVKVKLDPALSLTDNAERYFKKARKAERALALLKKRAASVERSLQVIEEFSEDIPEQVDAEESERVSRELDRLSGRVRGSTAARKPGAEVKSGATFNPRTFETSDGMTIIVGRNNKENDYVTHHLAKPEDLWFHASAMPGSHVVLKKKGKSAPSRRAIEEAASVAAYFSKGRTSSGVPVIYTEKKYVHKPRGARPGLATCARERFLMVTPRKPKSTPP